MNNDTTLIGYLTTAAAMIEAVKAEMKSNDPGANPPEFWKGKLEEACAEIERLKTLRCAQVSELTARNAELESNLKEQQDTITESGEQIAKLNFDLTLTQAKLAGAETALNSQPPSGWERVQELTKELSAARERISEFELGCEERARFRSDKGLVLNRVDIERRDTAAQINQLTARLRTEELTAISLRADLLVAHNNIKELKAEVAVAQEQERKTAALAYDEHQRAEQFKRDHATIYDQLTDRIKELTYATAKVKSR